MTHNIIGKYRKTQADKMPDKHKIQGSGFSFTSLFGQLALLSLLLFILSVSIQSIDILRPASFASLLLFLVCYGFLKIRSDN